MKIYDVILQSLQRLKVITSYDGDDKLNSLYSHMQCIWANALYIA